MFRKVLITIIWFCLRYDSWSCSGFSVPQQLLIRGIPVLHSDSDFMGDIARDRVTRKTLAKSSADAKNQDQFVPPSNFERDELLRVLAEINSMNVSWFQLTPFAQRRYAKSVMCILESPSALDLVSASTSPGAFSLGSAAEGLWRVTLSNEDIYKAWTKGMQIYFNIRNTSPNQSGSQSTGSGSENKEEGRIGNEGVFEQIVQLPLPPGGIVPSRIRQVGTLTQNKVDGSIEYSFQKTLVTWLGKEWLWPFGGDSGPSGCLGVSYMDGKVWLDVRDLAGSTTSDSAAASKFTALTYISAAKKENEWCEIYGTSNRNDLH